MQHELPRVVPVGSLFTQDGALYSAEINYLSSCHTVMQPCFSAILGVNTCCCFLMGQGFMDNNDQYGVQNPSIASHHLEEQHRQLL